MTCAEARPRLSAYHDGELDAALHAMIGGHVAGCAACRAYLQDLARLSALFQAGRGGEIAAGMWARIGAAAGRSRRRRTVRGWALRAGAVAAGLALYLLGHGALVSAVLRDEAPAVAEVQQLEQTLQEAALALAGRGLAEQEFAAFSPRPEERLLRELAEDVTP